MSSRNCLWSTVSPGAGDVTQGGRLTDRCVVQPGTCAPRCFPVPAASAPLAIKTSRAATAALCNSLVIASIWGRIGHPARQIWEGRYRRRERDPARHPGADQLAVRASSVAIGSVGNPQSVVLKCFKPAGASPPCDAAVQRWRLGLYLVSPLPVGAFLLLGTRISRRYQQPGHDRRSHYGDEVFLHLGYSVPATANALRTLTVVVRCREIERW